MRRGDSREKIGCFKRVYEDEENQYRFQENYHLMEPVQFIFPQIFLLKKLYLTTTVFNFKPFENIIYCQEYTVMNRLLFVTSLFRINLRNYLFKNHCKNVNF